MSTEVMSAVDEAVTNWCQSCQDLRQEVEKLKAEHALNYKALKDKIISTDKLIKRYTAKCQEYDSQTKKLEETSDVLQNYKSDCESFESQLKTALEELAPLKQNNQKYEKLCTQLEKKLEKSDIKLQAAEGLHKQFSLANKELEKKNEKLKEEKSAAEKKIKELESLGKKHEASLKKLQDELDTKKKEITSIKKENSSCKSQANRLQMRSDCWRELLKSHGLLRKGERMFGRWKREKNSSSLKLNDLKEESEEDEEEDDTAASDDDLFDAFDTEAGPSGANDVPGGAGDSGVHRQDSLVEMILAEMLDDTDTDPLDFTLLTSLSPAVSPLRQSPSSEDEGQLFTSDDDFNDVAEQLEQSVLNSAKKKPREKGKGKKKKGKLKVVESTLGPQGVLEIQESLSDTEQEGEADVPFTKVGVKTRSSSRSQDDGVFKEPLPVSPFRSRKRRGASLSSSDSLSPILAPLNSRVTRSSSFPGPLGVSVGSPGRSPAGSLGGSSVGSPGGSPKRPLPILPLVAGVKKSDDKSENESENKYLSEMKGEEMHHQQKDNSKQSKQQSESSEKPSEKSERLSRTLRKRKGSLSDSDGEDLTISRRSLRSSSTSSDEGSGEESTRSTRRSSRSPRTGSRSPRIGSNVLSPPSRLTRSRKTTEESMVMSEGENDSTDTKSKKKKVPTATLR